MLTIPHQHAGVIIFRGLSFLDYKQEEDVWCHDIKNVIGCNVG